MKILQVITSLQMGGAEQIVVELTDRLIKIGHQVDICIFNGTNISVTLETLSNDWDGYRPQLFIMGNSYYNPLYMFKLRKLMKKYDIVHTHNSSPQLYAAIGNVGLRKNLITTEHNTDNRKRRNFLLSCVDRWMYKRYDHIVCISELAELMLRKYLRCNDDNITTIPNGVDVFRINNNKEIVLEKGNSQGKFIVLMVAAFRAQKDQDTLVRAIAKLGEGYEAWFAGNGIREDEVKALARKIAPNTTKFLGVRRDVPQLLHSADVVVMSSHYEGLSLSNIEGMAAGRPFVASDVNGLREVTSGYGLLFPEEDDVALADIIKRLNADRTFYQNIADKCWERAQQFDVDRMVVSYERQYKKIMAE